MKYLIIVLLIITSTFTLSAQNQFNKSRQEKVMIKLSPTMPFMEKFGGGVEYMFTKNQSFEIEASISNLNAKSTDFIYGNVSYDYNKYHSLSMRYKAYYQNSSMKERTGLYNGIYFAPGFKAGTMRNNFYEQRKVQYLAFSTDVGATVTVGKKIVLEGFMGWDVRAVTENSTIQGVGTSARVGFRIGTTI